MSKQDIEKRLGFAAQGAKAKFGLSPSEMKENQRRIETNIRYEAGEMRNLSSNMRFIKDEIERLTAEIKNTRDIKRKAQLSLKLDAENKKMKDQVAYLRRARQMIQENQADAKSLGITLDPKWSGNFSRPGAKAEMGFLSRVGYAATALTADPADPKSPEYRKQVSEAKAAAKDAITNYKFMRDKVKERLAALDAYVTNAIKVINSATSAKDIEHYVEQLRIAVKSQSMILGASKSPFSRPGVKAKMALTIYTVGAKNACYEALANLKALAQLASETNSGWDFHVTVMTDHVKNAMSQLESSPAQAGRYLERAIDTLGMLRKIDPVRLNDIQKGSLKQLIGYVAKSLRDARANIKVVTTASRPGAKAKMSATFIVAEAIFNAENAVRRGDNENARRWIKAAQDAMDETVVSTGMRSKLEQLVKRYKMSRPGVKAKFDTKVGSKGNKSAMIAKNGPDADASWLAWVVQHHGEGQGESVLGTMRSYSTEARAKAAALRGLETSGLRGGFSRPGVKAKMGSSQVNDSATTADLIREAQRLRDVIKTSNREFDKTHLRQIKQELDRRGVLMPYGASEVLASRSGMKAKA